MTSSKPSDATVTSPQQPYYHPLPAEAHNHNDPPQPPPQYIYLLPRYYNNDNGNSPPFLSRKCQRRLICLIPLLLILGLAVFLLWPSDPEISVVRLRLDHFRIHTFPKISLDLTLDLTIKIRNRDFFSIDYKSLIVSVGYRGKQLGYVTSDHGHVKARASSYINATLQLDGVEILSDVFPLIEDLTKGEITFDSVTKIGGQLGLIFFEVPLEAKVSCEISVNTHNQTIERQNCYPE
ncbi:hypothetical protein ACH5RR_008100 [Cinchona calisaya]|uniref:Late embryogenesis abundant protein LEA-2 subgroup domain-containing protein n=1 Tax=Cinchona calisaya TaxID=153742 RepID=A0ABD3AB43_9GENT